ncbi:hypothetical protein BJX68DRAFT_258712 [Aspergillus pseudodeflectus]|uniref:C6 transcription factor n=1 Tax=Aspergillus pseudodeflectus TaxID=176178 RepID=A0ABR4JJD9_9EURO
MHKYSTETYKRTIPQRALHFPLLLDGVLSVVALHTTTTKTPEEAGVYIDMLVGFQTRSLEPFQRVIEAISPENCDAVFAYSVFTIIHGIAVPELTRLETIFVLSELVQGTAEITKMFGQALQRTTALDAEDNEAFRRLHDATIPHLRMCCQRYRGHQNPGSVLTRLAIVDRQFVKSLREKDDLALLALVHWGFLLGQPDGETWWALRFGLAMVNKGLGSLNPDSHSRD